MRPSRICWCARALAADLEDLRTGERAPSARGDVVGRDRARHGDQRRESRRPRAQSLRVADDLAPGRRPLCVAAAGPRPRSSARRSAPTSRTAASASGFEITQPGVPGRVVVRPLAAAPARDPLGRASRGERVAPRRRRPPPGRTPAPLPRSPRAAAARAHGAGAGRGWRSGPSVAAVEARRHSRIGASPPETVGLPPPRVPGP